MNIPRMRGGSHLDFSTITAPGFPPHSGFVQQGGQAARKLARTLSSPRLLAHGFAIVDRPVAPS